MHPPPPTGSHLDFGLVACVIENGGGVFVLFCYGATMLSCYFLFLFGFQVVVRFAPDMCFTFRVSCFVVQAGSAACFLCISFVLFRRLKPSYSMVLFSAFFPSGLHSCRCFCFAIFCRFKYDYMVLDEGHSIKNIKSSRFQRLRMVAARHRLLLR